MTNPAKNVFWTKADLGFYTGPNDTLTITVKEASADVTYEYNRATEKWMNAADELDISSLSWTNYDIDLTGTGKWRLNKGADAIAKPTGDIDVKAWINKNITPSSEPAPRTVYMDSNIALTDGKAPVGTGGAKTIPNLYEAIHDMDTRIDSIAKTHATSTADAGLFVKHISRDGDSYQAFSKRANDGIEISVGNGLSSNGADRNAEELSATEFADYNMHFKANEITFTVSNPNNKIGEAYKIKNVDDVNTKIKTDGVQSICSMMIGVKSAAAVQGASADLEQLGECIGDITYYWVPMEDNTGTGYISSSGSDNIVSQNAHGKIFMNIAKPDGFDSALETLSTSTTVAITQGNVTVGTVAKTLDGIYDKNGTVVYASHAVVTHTDGLAVGEKKNDLSVTSTMTYNLGAIIEAIQELNRRTMFMDTDMSFNGAMSYGDYQADKVGDVIHYGHILDGLPAATDSGLVQHYGSA